MSILGDKQFGVEVAKHLDEERKRLGEWKDISTAPRDGSRILLTNGNIVASGYWPLGFFRRDPGFYFDGASLPSGASHWMPLPPPPAPKGEAA